MSSRFDSSSSTGKSRKTPRTDRGKSIMSETQIQAYLFARDTLRRIQRTSALLVPLGRRTMNGMRRRLTGRGTRP